MKIAAIPLDIVWSDKSENILAMVNTLRSLEKGTDLVVLPELFSTGFINDRQLLSALAETNNGPTIDAVKCWSAFHNVAICGSFLAKNGGNYFNRAFFIEPSGEETFYDKAHLFSMSEECDLLTRGTAAPPIVRFRGWNVSFMICYDLRFPMWSRNVECKYDIMLVPANWPMARRYAWERLLAARAIENQAYYVGCNRSGSDDYGDYDRQLTCIYDYTGHPVSTDDGKIVTATEDKQAMDRYREKFPVWRDSDRFTLI